MRFIPPTCNHENSFIVFGIRSKIGNVRHRNVIRETWGNSDAWKRIKNGDPKTRFDVKLVFIIGLDVIGRHYNIQKENDQFGDILQVEFTEGFYNESLKDHYFMKYSHQLCPNADYLVKVSDDIFINPKTFWHSWETSIKSETIALSGCLDKETPTIRDPRDKKFVPDEWYKGHHSSYYAEGNTKPIKVLSYEDRKISFKSINPSI